MEVSSSIVSLSTDAVSLDCANTDCDSDISLPSCDWSTDSDHEVSLPIACNATDVIEDEELSFLPSPVDCSTPKKVSCQSKSLCLPSATSSSSKISETSTQPLSRSALAKGSSKVVRVTAIKPPTLANWELTTVFELNGCSPKCASSVHGLTEFEVLRAHSLFSDKSTQEQNKWILEYFNTHCPSDRSTGDKTPKDLTYVIGGKVVCMNVWLQVLPLSLSRFYRLRQECVKYEANPGLSYKKPRSQSSKTMDAVAWMAEYFERVGDKRPDKDGIYLPTCLTEKKIYEIMVEQLGMESCISPSQFNKIFKNDFKHVTIPKVRQKQIMYSMIHKLSRIVSIYPQECRFTKCDFCSLMKIEMCKASNSKDEKNKLRKVYDEHLAVQE